MRDIHPWISGDDAAAANRFLDIVDAAARQIGAHPESGVQRLGFLPPNIRLLFLSRYPYAVVYRADSTPPLILRIVHGARDLPRLLR